MNYQLFVDLDGVLADFDAGVYETTGSFPHQLSPRTMWPALARTPDFYARLPWMPDGKELWAFVSPLDPVILTGLPLGKWARPQKLEWCRRELGEEVPVITCMSREKPRSAQDWINDHSADAPTPVLVDDRPRILQKWESIGGIFVHHTGAQNSMRQLVTLGIGTPPPEG